MTIMPAMMSKNAMRTQLMFFFIVQLKFTITFLITLNLLFQV
jgi:hypothetical protein